MREERGQLEGDRMVYEHVDLWGTVLGNVLVVDEGKLYVRGAIYGNLTVDKGGRAHIYGNVTGELIVKEGAKVILSGNVTDVTNRGGRLYIESTAKVLGKLRTKTGETVVDPKAFVADAG